MQSMLEPVLGGVYSPSAVAPPGWWPAVPGGRSTEVSLPFSTSMEKGSSQQVELKDEGGAAGYMGGGADRQIERSSLNFSSQGGIILKSESILSWYSWLFVLLVTVLDKAGLAKELDMMQ